MGKGSRKGSGGSKRSLHKAEFLDAVKRRLGLARGEYHSSEDEDYALTSSRRPSRARQSSQSQETKAAAGKRPGRTAAQASSPPNLAGPPATEKEAATGEEVEELTLTQRSAQLKRHRATAEVAAIPASQAIRRRLDQQQQQQQQRPDDHAVRQQGNSVDLPPDVLERVLRFAAAHGAVPVLPVGGSCCARVGCILHPQHPMLIKST